MNVGSWGREKRGSVIGRANQGMGRKGGVGRDDGEGWGWLVKGRTINILSQGAIFFPNLFPDSTCTSQI